MTDTNEVYRKIKEMSKRVPNPRPQIPVHNIAGELAIGSEQIRNSLEELKKLRLIQYDGKVATSIRLTLLGSTVNR